MSHVHSPRTDEFGGHLWMKLIISFPVVLLSFIFLLSKRKAKSVSHADTPTPPIPRDTHPLPPPVPHGFLVPHCLARNVLHSLLNQEMIFMRILL